MTSAARRWLAGWAAAALAAAGHAVAAAAPDPVYAPCLFPQPDLAGYQAAFEVAGWTVPEGEARDAALRGPSEHLFSAMFMHDPAETLEELAARQAEAHEWGREEFAGALVVAKDDMAAAVDILANGEQSRLRCIVTAPKLGAVRRILGNAQPEDWVPFTIGVEFPMPLPGTSDLQIEAIRATRLVTPPEPLPGTEAIVVGATLEKAAE